MKHLSTQYISYMIVLVSSTLLNANSEKLSLCPYSQEQCILQYYIVRTPKSSLTTLPASIMTHPPLRTTELVCIKRPTGKKQYALIKNARSTFCTVITGLQTTIPLEENVFTDQMHKLSPPKVPANPGLLQGWVQDCDDSLVISD